MTLLYCFITSLVIVFFTMPIFIRLMLKYHILDSSVGRKKHNGNKVNMGGIIIFLACIVSCLLAMHSYKPSCNIDYIITFLIVLCCIAIVGVRDDMNTLSAKTKLIIEIIFILFICNIGLRIDNLFGFFGIHKLPIVISYAATIFFIVVVLNAYNLIDGIDGQAATQALNVIVPLFLFFMLCIPKNYICQDCFGSPILWRILLVSVGGGLIGFLFFNWEPSKVFMGDTGSITIGTIIACSMIVAMQYNGYLGSEAKICGLVAIKSKIGVVCVLFFIPFADTLRVFCDRIKRGFSPFHPDRSHIHHLFLRTGATHAKTSLLTLTFSVTISIIGMILSTLVDDNIFIPLIVVMFFLYVITLHYVIKFRIKKMRAKQLCQKK